METETFVVIALAILGFGVISGRAQHSILTPPMVFVALGLVLSRAGWMGFHLEEHLIHTLAEITLVLVLFTDASRIDLRLLRREHDLPVRLLLVGLPLTITLGAALAAFLFPALSLWEAALLAAILAPTDAALGQAVVSSPLVPVRIRQTLNVESGLNDGIALPVVLLLMSACVAQHGDGEGAAYWIRFATLQVTLGPLVGIAVGYLGARIVRWGARSGWMESAFQRLSSLALALLAFAAAEMVGGNGFIAAFVAGLVLGNVAREHIECLYEFAEAEGQLLTLLVFLVFGAALAPEALAHLGGTAVLYAVLSLTLIRMLPVALALVKTGVKMPTVLFLGWFGPRGIASILFGLLVVQESPLKNREEILAIVLLTVLGSVFAHGLTAYPLAKWYSRCSNEQMDEDAVERQSVSEMPT